MWNALTISLDSGAAIVLAGTGFMLAFGALPALRGLVRSHDATQPKIVGVGAPPNDEAAQSRRLFSFLDRKARSVELAIAAHRAAAQHIDSAEYQLTRLMQEFPFLADRSRRVAARPR